MDIPTNINSKSVTMASKAPPNGPSIPVKHEDSTSSCKHNYGPSLHDCDYWVRTQGNSCAELTSTNGFDCTGCVCNSDALRELKECIDYGPELHSCDYWIELNVGQSCPELESKHGYDCSGCKKCVKN